MSENDNGIRRAIFFDLDGTIIDSFPGISRSVNHVFQTLKLSIPEEAELREFIGPPLRTSFGRYLTSDEEIENAVGIYREFYGREGVLDVTLYEGVIELLLELSETDDLFLCTSKPAVYATQIIFHLNMQTLFRQAYAPELSGRFDCKDDLLAFALHEEKVAPENAFMIGDRASDIQAG
ncbi:MAG: HAD hydrolase-like protein, partial [bacterium]|nr:HAD hydrolase-like protein [bacterium]